MQITSWISGNPVQTSRAGRPARVVDSQLETILHPLPLALFSGLPRLLMELQVKLYVKGCQKKKRHFECPPYLFLPMWGSKPTHGSEKQTK